MPAENAADLEEIPDEVMSELNFHLVHDLDEVMDIALLGEGPRGRRLARGRTGEGEPAEGGRPASPAEPAVSTEATTM